MRLPFTLTIYIIRQFLVSTLIVFATFSILIMLIDTLELLRRSHNKDIPFFILSEMVLMKYPLMAHKILPFAVLVGSVIAFTKLNRSHEIVIMRAAGISIWEFMIPVALAAFLLGTIYITLFNPVGCAMLSRFERLEGKYLHGRTSMLAVSSSGLWLRQKNTSSVGEKEGETIIHALRSGQNNIELFDVIVFVFGENDTFIRRIDAQKAELIDDFWRLSNVLITSPESPASKFSEYFLETDLTTDQIHNSFAPPETISFWALPSFINTLKSAGFSAVKHRLHWHTILSSPLFLSAMVLIAALFSMRPPRFGKTGLLITGSVVTGFLIYFLTNLVLSLGLSGGIPVYFAAWMPVVVSLLAGVGLLLHLEDG